MGICGLGEAPDAVNISIQVLEKGSEWMHPHVLISSQLLPTPHLPSVTSPLAGLPACPTDATQGQPCGSAGHILCPAVTHQCCLGGSQTGLGRSGTTSAFSPCPSHQPLQEGTCPPGWSEDKSLVLGECPEVQDPIDLSSPVTLDSGTGWTGSKPQTF